MTCVFHEARLTREIMRQWPRDFFGLGAAPVLDLSKSDNKTVPAAMCFSSGTSGKPKGVMLSHHNLIAHMLATRSGGPRSFNDGEVEVFYAPREFIIVILDHRP